MTVFKKKMPVALRIVAVLFVLLWFQTETAATEQRPRQTVGLVLSGGGAKGIAHIGVIQAFEDNGIPIDYVAGTSMGAIVGGLYVSGYSPSEMLALINSRGFSYWSTGRIDENLVYYFNKEEPTPAIGGFDIRSRHDRSEQNAVPSSLISPLPMNFAFMQIFAAHTAQCGGDFNRLMVPFRCVASDVAKKRKVVFSHGHLEDAVRASMSFPIVFQPIEIDGDLMYDGGIYDNFPVDVMRDDFHPDIMIGVDVSTQEKHPSPDFVNQMENMVIQDNNYDLPANEGIKLRIDLNEFSLLDFPKADIIYKIGYEHAMAMIDSIKTRVSGRVAPSVIAERRAAFKQTAPPLVFQSVSTTGGTKRQNEYIDYLFDQGAKADTFNIEHARDAFYRAVSTGRMRDLKPDAAFDSRTGMFDLTLKSNVKNNMRLNFGGYLTSSMNSMVFMSAGYHTLSFRSLEANVNAWIGQSYMAGMVNVGLHLRTGNPSSITLQGVVARQKFHESDRLFYLGTAPTYVTDMSAYGKLTYECAAGRHGKAGVGYGYGYMDDRYYDRTQNPALTSDKDRSTFRMQQIFVRYQMSTLDNLTYPVSGASATVSVAGVLSDQKYRPNITGLAPTSQNDAWLRLDVRASKYFDLSRRLSIGGEMNVFVTGRHLNGDYNASIVSAPAFNPTPSSYNTFNPGLRANGFCTLGVVPVWKPMTNMQVRGAFHVFRPWRRIEREPDGAASYGGWWPTVTCFGQLAAVYTFPFAQLSAYCDYLSYPRGQWSGGVSFGLFFLAPEFFR